MREVGSNPDMKQFVGAGLQMKLLCQLGFILAAMCHGHLVISMFASMPGICNMNTRCRKAGGRSLSL